MGAGCFTQCIVIITAEVEMAKQLTTNNLNELQNINSRF